jgi:hypothetical protein
MSEGEYNQTNEHRRGRSQPDMDSEHETHTTALVLLVLATLVIVVVILAVSRTPDKDLSPGNYGNQITQPADETHGAGIPVEFAQASEISDTSGLPDDIPIPENADVMQNYESAIGDNGTQRVYMYSTTDQRSELSDLYQNWVDNSEFTLDDSSESNQNTTLRLSQGQNEQLIISITALENTQEVQINYINQSN